MIHGGMHMTSMALTQNLCDSAKPLAKRYDLRDTRIRGLFMRVEVTGRKTWYINYRTPYPERKLKNLKLVSASLASLNEARAKARQLLAKLYLEHEDPALSIKCIENKTAQLKLEKLIELYEPWVTENQKSGAVTIRALKLFKEFLTAPVNSITKAALTAWRQQNIGLIKRSTINRRVAALCALLRWGRERGLIASP